MKQYDYLLFDLDDTIFDFQAAQKKALDRIIQGYVPQIDEAVFRTVYNKINRHLWSEYENGKIMKSYIMLNRFTLTFKELAVIADGETAALDYQKYLSEGYDLLPGALESLKQLKKEGYPMYVVSNGEFHTQMSRLAGADITQYFEAIYISEQTGSQKPNTKFFDYVFTHSPEIEKTKTLIIGDSISSDIKGAQNYGLDSCWFNVFQEQQTSGATYEVSNHQQLQNLLINKKVAI